MKFRDFSKNLIDWYKRNYRPLPWRSTRDPYKIWLSEIILQQTRVVQGFPYYEKFISRYPTLKDLAQAPDDEVMRLWQGLGYYSRARNLLKCARKVVVEHNGRFPESYEDLKKLPGIGNYTAAAIASFAFKEKVAVVDGNVYRVLSRIFGLEQDISKSSSSAFFKNFSENYIPADEPDIYNQAIMEFGATHCVPRNPLCSTCIFTSYCFAFQHDRQDQFPVKSKKVKVRERSFYYLFLFNEKGGMLNQRGVKDIWAGLYDFLFVEAKSLQSLDELLEKVPELRNTLSTAVDVDMSGEVKHVLSHQKLKLKLITAQVHDLPEELLINGNRLKFYTWDEIDNLPKPILIANFLHEKFSAFSC